jgi:hypothetical protein
MAVPPPRLGLVTSTYRKAGHTFVNHHVAHLWGGETAVICTRFTGDNPEGRPVFAHNQGPRPLADRLARPAWQIGDVLRHRALNMIHGAPRRGLLDFLARENVQLLLAEFGNRALQIAPLARAAGLPLFAYFRGFDASKLLAEPLYPAATAA